MQKINPPSFLHELHWNYRPIFRMFSTPVARYFIVRPQHSSVLVQYSPRYRRLRTVKILIKWLKASTALGEYRDLAGCSARTTRAALERDGRLILPAYWSASAEQIDCQSQHWPTFFVLGFASKNCADSVALTSENDFSRKKIFCAKRKCVRASDAATVEVFNLQVSYDGLTCAVRRIRDRL